MAPGRRRGALRGPMRTGPQRERIDWRATAARLVGRAVGSRGQCRGAGESATTGAARGSATRLDHVPAGEELDGELAQVLLEEPAGGELLVDDARELLLLLPVRLEGLHLELELAGLHGFAE